MLALLLPPPPPQPPVAHDRGQSRSGGLQQIFTFLLHSSTKAPWAIKNHMYDELTVHQMYLELAARRQGIAKVAGLATDFNRVNAKAHAFPTSTPAQNPTTPAPLFLEQHKIYLYHLLHL